MIVVDLTYFLCGVPTNSRKEQLCGGRSHHFLRDVESFFARLNDLGVRMAFFSNAYTKDEEFEKWSKRAEGRYEREISVLDKIYHGATLEETTKFCIANKIFISLQKLTHPTIWEIARRNGRTFKMYDVTRSVAAYANEHKAFAVLGNNTDYLIFGGDWRYWNANKLHMRDMTTLEFNKDFLRSHFRLSVDQMAVLATILGNHIVDPKAVEKFHALLTVTPLIKAVANFVSKSTEETPDSEDMEMVIAIAVERNYDKSLVQKSLEYYHVVSFSDKSGDELRTSN